LVPQIPPGNPNENKKISIQVLLSPWQVYRSRAAVSEHFDGQTGRTDYVTHLGGGGARTWSWSCHLLEHAVSCTENWCLAFWSRKRMLLYSQMFPRFCSMAAKQKLSQELDFVFRYKAN